MTHGSFRHLIVLDDAEPVGVVSVRDIIRCWTPRGRCRSAARQPSRSAPGRARGAGSPTGIPTPLSVHGNRSAPAQGLEHGPGTDRRSLSASLH